MCLERVIITGAAAELAQVQQLVVCARALPAYGATARDVAALRLGALAFAAGPLARPVSPDVTMEDIDAGGVPARWFRPVEPASGACVLYLPGGGYVCGGIEAGRGVAASLAQTLSLPVLALGYRQAPEHPFPAAVTDAVAGLAWLAGQGGGSIILAGDSAGATLAVVAALRTARLVAAVIAVCGWFDLAMPGASWRENRGRDLVDRELGLFFREAYLAGADMTDPSASPIHADLTGLPPLLVQMGGHEGGLSDAEAFAVRAAAAGVSVRLEVHAGLPHNFVKFNLTVADTAYRRMAEWLAGLDLIPA